MVRGVLVCVLLACSLAQAAPPQPVVLARWDTPAGIVTASGPELIVYTPTTIAALPRTGGPARALVTLDDTIYDLIADDARVYWIAHKGDEIWSVDRKTGGPPRRLIAAPRRVLSTLAIAGGTIVYQEHGDTVSIVAIDRDGSRRRVLAKALAAPTPHVVVDRSVYYGARSQVWVVALTGGAPRVLATETAKITVELVDPVRRDRAVGTREELAPITAVAADATAVYFAGPKGARRVARRGGAWTAFPPGIPPFYVQNAQAWFTREGPLLLRIPKAGGATEALATAAGPIGTLAIDDQVIYFNVGGTLMRLDLE